MEERSTHRLLRKRTGHEATVSFSELLFDLIYVFAVTQLSHYLLHHFSFHGLLQMTVVWFGVWLVWQHTTWVTNWFNPDTRAIRLMLFIIMVIGLFMTASIPGAFEDKGLLFAVCYVTMQVGRTITVIFLLGNNHSLSANFKRILGWMCISGVFWITGAMHGGDVRLLLWAIAVLADYTSPMFGFYLPGLGRSDSGKEWTIEGHHLVERCQLFVIIAFGETILMTGTSLSEFEHWSAEKVLSALVSFIASLAMWWIYFDVSSKIASRKIMNIVNPGLLGLKYHAVHVVLVGAIILCAVGDELVVSEPSGMVNPMSLFVLVIGPALYLLTNVVYKWITCRIISKIYIAGIILLLLSIPFTHFVNILIVNVITTSVLVLIVIAEIVYPTEEINLPLAEE